MPDLKIAVVTGASRGLGLAIATEFATKDWRVIGTARSPQPTKLPADIEYRQFDASNAAECESFWQRLTNEHANAEICLINNAGGYVSGGLTETTPADYMQQLQSSYLSAVYMTRGLALSISRAKIINIISNSALAAHKNNSAYGAAKAAQMHFFQSLQAEFKPAQYQISNLYPSDIASDGPNPAAIKPADLARFIVEQAENDTSYYVRDVTLYPR